MAALRLHPRMTVLFVFLSCADLALTCCLLRFSGGEVYEANRIAAEVLACYGEVGLAVFKALVVLFAGALVSIVASYRPHAARRLAAFACLAVGGVVVYSVALWGYVAAQPTYHCQEPAVIARETQRLEQFARRQAEFRARLEREIDAVAAGRATAREAVIALLPSWEIIDPEVLYGYRTQTGAKSDEECLAGMVLSGALPALHDEGSPAARSRAEQLLAAHQTDHGPGVLAHLQAIRALPDRSPGEKREAFAVAGLPAAPEEDAAVEAVAPRERPRLDDGCGSRDDRNRRARRGPRFVSARCPAG
ncbi:MAG: DUF5658 family protein [Gemmataceae bacterium]|nr:DUF5658 family protein [Gemmataceae bacterium]